MSMQTILLKQHIGAPCEPVVSAGDQVRRGTLIAKPAGLGANIHASVSGKVAAVTETAIQIEADAEQPDDFVSIEGETNLDLIKAAGLVGMGGAGFPTAVKLNVDLKGGYILVNAAECEPVLEHNMQQIRTKADMTVRGIKYIMEICNADHGVIAIKAKHEKEVAILNEAIKGDDKLSIHLLPDLYPMGEERAVVREVLGTLLDPTQLPSAADAVVINVETVLRAAEAIELHRPAITKNITVIGKLKGGPQAHVFMDVPVGTTVGELIERAGGIDGEYGEIILGGPFTGSATTLDTPITKTTGGIIVTQPFEDLKGRKVGLLVCACGGNENRMRDIAAKMNGEVISVQKCKQAAEIKGALKCENPGNCPGQAQKCINFKKDGCEDIIIGNCSDCTNTVMGSAPKLGLAVHHQTDHVLQTVGKEVMRHLTTSKKLEEAPAEVSAQVSAEPQMAEAEKPAVKYTATVNDGILRIHIEEGKDINIEFPFH